jgi:hypothetical protein
MMHIFKFSIYGAEGRTRTDTEVAPQQFLRLPRLPFRHFGVLKLENLIPIYSPPIAGRQSATNLPIL